MDHQQSVKNQFGDNAHKYVTSTLHAKGKDLEMMKAWVEQSGLGDSLLDIATGGGHVANSLASYFKKLVALDLTTEMLNSAKSFIESNGHRNVSFIEGDAQELPFADRTFEVVTCRIAAHHFPDIKSFVKETHRVLKEDGAFVLADNVAPEVDEFDNFYNELEKKRDYSHFRAYKKSEWIAMIEEEGFTVESLFTFSKTFQFESWCERMSLSEEEIQHLNNWIVAASDATKSFFCMNNQDGKVQSFQGQSVVIIAKK